MTDHFYRVGQTVYRQDHLVGILDTVDQAELVVEALNARERVLAGRGTCRRSPQDDVVVGTSPVPPEPSERQQVLINATCGRVGVHNCGVTGRWQSHDTGSTDEPPVGSYP